MNTMPIKNKEQDDIDETSFSKNDDFEMIDYVLVYQKYSDRRLQEYRNIYLKNLVTFGLKLRNVLLKYFINIFSLFKLFLLLIKQDISDTKNNYILVHTPYQILLEIAEKTNLNLPIELNDLDYKSVTSSAWNKIIACFNSPEAIEISNIQRKYFTAPYKQILHNQ